MKHILLLIFFPIIVSAQSNACFADFRNQGLAYMSQKDYGEALSQFVAAIVVCEDIPVEHDISQKIEECKRKWAADLQASVTEAQKAYQEALTAKNDAENAKIAESEARKIAEENARRAYQRGLRAESYRLALLADMARQQNKKNHAFMLAWMGLQLSDTIQPFVMRAFCEAASDSLGRTVFSTPHDILSTQFLNEGRQLLVQTSAPAWFLLHMDGSLQITEFPANFTQIVPSPDGQRFLALDKSNQATILNLAGKSEAILKGHTEPIRSACWTAMGDFALTCSRDNTARIWDDQGKLLSTLSGHNANVQSIEYGLNAQCFLTRSSDGTAKLWGPGSICQQTFSDPEAMIVSAAFIGSNVMLQYNNHKTEFRNTKGELLRSINQEAIYQPIVQYTPELLWFPTTPKTTSGSPPRLPMREPELAVIQTTPKTLLIVDSNGQTLGEITLPGKPTGCSIAENKYIVVWDQDNNITLWQPNGALVQTFSGHRKPILNAVYHVQNQLMLSTSHDGTQRLWNEQGQVLSEWTSIAKNKSGAAFTPLGDAICVYGDAGKSIKLSPVPAYVLGTVDRKATISSSLANEVKMIYGIQYWEKLDW